MGGLIFIIPTIAITLFLLFTGKIEYSVNLMIVLFVFFSISGISCTFSRNNAKRGFILGAIALLYTLGSYVAQEYIGISGVFVAFGVLDFLAVSMLL